MTAFLRPGDERDVFAAKWELEFEDVAHFKEFYRMTHEFLIENDWSDPEGGENFEYFYFERTYPGGGPKEHRAWWRVHYVPNQSQYVRYFMKLDYRTLNMRQVEVVVDGKKYKTWKGGVTIYCDAYVQLDYQNKWKNHWFLKNFDRFFRKRIYKQYWEGHKRECYKKCYELNREMKKFFQVKSPVKEPRLFRHGRGVPAAETALHDK